MKKLFLTLAFILSLAFAKAQVVSIPDINFKLYLLSASPTNQIAKDLSGNWTKIDTNNDNLIQQSEANNISYLKIAFNSTSNDQIQGFLSFNNLKTLIIQNIYLTALNLSTLQLLEEIQYINHECSSWFVNFNYFDVSGCSNLKKVSIIDRSCLDYQYYNNSNLSFNFSNLQNLEEVFIDYRTYSQLNPNAFSFNNCNNLKKLTLRLVSSVLNIDLQNLSSLEEFNFFAKDDYTSWDSAFGWFYSGLNSLNFTGSTSIKKVSYIGGGLLVNNINFDNFSNLTDFTFSNSGITNYNSISFQNCINLKNLRIFSKQNTSNIPQINLNNSIMLENLEIGAYDIVYNANSSYDFNLQNLDVSDCVSLKNLKLYNTLVPNLDLTNNHLLETLQCQNNQLTSLDLSSCGNLQSVNCDNNNLEYISFKNNTNETKSFLNNPNLTYICADDTEQWDVQLIVNLYEMWDTCMVGDYCSFTPNGNYNAINGNALYDNENDGCDINDEVFQFLRINLTDGTNSGSTFTNFNGDYVFYGNAGTFTLTPQLENPTYFNVSPATANFTFANNNNNVASQNFCITPNGVHNHVEVVLAQVTPARPGFDAEYSLVYKNKGNQPISGAVSVTFDDAKLDFVSSSTVPTSNATGLLSWDYSNLLPFENRSITFTLNVNSPQETPAVNNGDGLTFTANITPATDEISADNNYILNQIVVGSYDPNDIYCLEGAVLDPNEIGNYLHYNVRFENTGTAAAENIVVAATINPAEYDLSTMQVLNASHNVYTRINGNLVEFIFENCQLSSGGHGNILFKMKSRNNLQVNDAVTSNANIFFDYNFPIETNDATTVFETLSNQNFTKDNSVKMYPNPAKETVTISAKTNLLSITIYDAQGRIVQFVKAGNLEKTIDISSLSKGIYIFDIVTENGRMIEKLVKE